VPDTIHPCTKPAAPGFPFDGLPSWLSAVVAFGLTWEDAADMLSRLGHRATVEIQALRA
jgi:hypothetical protein